MFYSVNSCIIRMSKLFTDDDIVVYLPNSTLLLCVTSGSLAPKGFVEIFRVSDCSINPCERRRVRISYELLMLGCLALVRAPHLRKAKEEDLFGR
mmetsp:Transcript_1656/g.2998  ORF Transcript_1656/g.2998 Transcript_1656/m.2998 type:complete len:95 (-) Transcript_1656:2031-2315(-)